MLAKFFRESALVQAFTDLRSGPERLAASPWATATTPDQIIVAHILESVAKDSTKWRWVYQPLPTDVSFVKNYSKFDEIPIDIRYGSEYEFIGPDLRVQFRLSTDGSGPGWWVISDVTITRGKTDVFPIEKEAATFLTRRLQLLWGQMLEAQRVAKQAEDAMKMNEKKWNLAENLLGMKRNEFGALVPKD